MPTANEPVDPAPASRDLPEDIQVKKLTTASTLDKVHYKVDGRRALEEVLVITNGDKITVTDLDGEILIEHTPAPAPQ